MYKTSPPIKPAEPGRNYDKPGFLLPAFQALAIQAAALIFLYLILQVVWLSLGLQVTLGIAALLQGAIAAAFSYWRRLPVWWLAIQFLFPVTLLAAYALELPSDIFLGAFLILLLLYWTPFRTRVPLYLSGASIWDAVAENLPKDQPIRFIDAGSGLGGLVLDLAKRFPKASFTGVELAPLPWAVSWIRGRFAHSPAKFVLGNYNKIDFSQFDVVFAYLSPAAMDSLWGKAISEMRNGTLLLSYEFPILKLKPDIVIEPEAGRPLLYGWRISNISHQ